MSEDLKNLQDQLIKARLENKCYRESLDRGIVNASAIRLAFKTMEDRFTLIDGDARALSGATFSAEFEQAVRSSELLREIYSNENTPKTNDAQKALQAPEGTNKPYSEWSSAEKMAYRNEHGDKAFSQMVADHFKAEREAGK